MFTLMRRGIPGLGPDFRKLFAASAVSNLGDGIVYTAAPLLAASLTRDPVLVAVVMFMRGVPWLLFSLVSGVLVDRLDRRKVMGAFNSLRAAAIGFLSLAVLFGFANLPLLYLVFFVIGTCETFFDNASQTILPAVASRENFEKANGRLEGARIVTNDLAGPSLGGLLFGVSAAIPFLLNAGAFAGAAALILALKGDFRGRGATAPAGSLVADIKEGLGWLLRHRYLRLLALMGLVLGLLDEAVFAVFVLYAQDVLGLTASGYGLLFAVGAAGGIIGSFVVDSVVRRVGSGGAIFLSLILGLLSYIGIALAGNVVFVGLMLIVNGFHLVLWNVTTISLRQSIVPAGLLGRVNSAYRFVMMVGLTSGTLAGGAIARTFGLTAPFWFAAVLLAILTLVALANNLSAGLRER